jgi:nicotinamidase-related amidase
VIELAGKRIYDSIAEMGQPSHTALVIVDVTNDFCASDGYFAKEGHDISMVQAMMSNLFPLLDAARHAGVLVIHVQNTVLPSGMSDSPAFMRFKSKHVGKLPIYTVKGTWGWEFVEEFVPIEGEIVVPKHRPSAFVSTDLDQILRVAHVECLVVGGLATEGCVQSTAVDAMYRDYYTIVPPDCVGSYSRPLHDAGLRYLSPRVEVVGSAEIIDVWKSGLARE